MTRTNEVMTSANLTWLQVLHFRFESAIFDAGFEPQPPKLWCGIKVTGAQFEVETEGPNKGKLCKMIPGTIRKCTVTRKEIEEFELQNSN